MYFPENLFTQYFGSSRASHSSQAPGHAGAYSSAVAPLNSTASGRKTSEWLRSHLTKRVCCVGYLWYPLNSTDAEYLETVRNADEARVTRNKRLVEQLLSLERQLLHTTETQSCLEESIARFKLQHEALQANIERSCRSQRSANSSPTRTPRGVADADLSARTVNNALACCEQQLKLTAQQHAHLCEQQALLLGRQAGGQAKVAFETAPPKSPYETQSRWFSLDHLWNMHTALWLMLPPDHNIIIEFTFEGIFLCEGTEAAERIKYFHSAGIDFTVPEGHQGLVYDILCDYIDVVKDWTYASFSWNCQHFTGELYCNLVRGKQYTNEWHKSKDFLFKRMSDRWKSEWGKPTGDPFQYGNELEWLPWTYDELWPSYKTTV